MKHLTIVLILLVFPIALAAQPIYKVVDEHGNVTYTDQKPTERAEPMSLPGLSVMDRGAEPLPIEPETRGEERTALEFRIAAPESEQTVTNPDNRLTVSIASNVEIPPAAQVVIYIDGVAQPPVHSLSSAYEGLSPGEHSVRAELQTESGRLLASTDTVWFQMAAND
jgi:hypothetical protein